MLGIASLDNTKGYLEATRGENTKIATIQRKRSSSTLYNNDKKSSKPNPSLPRLRFGMQKDSFNFP
jgi:hypothetical protein